MWLDPELGAPRDWDLLSYFGIPGSLLAALLITRSGGNSKVLAIQSMVCCVLILSPQIYEKTHLPVALSRLDGLLWSDPHYATSYRGGKVAIQWGALLHEANRDDLALKYFRRCMQGGAFKDVAWYNLGAIYLQAGKGDSAEASMRNAYSLRPSNNEYRMGLITALQLLNRWEEAEALQSGAAQPGNTLYYHRWQGVSLANQGRLLEALVHSV